MDNTVGVPLIVPVAASMESPVGKFGEIDQVTTSPPREVGVSSVIATPLVYVYGLPL